MEEDRHSNQKRRGPRGSKNTVQGRIKDFLAYRDRPIVVDTSSDFLYIGKLLDVSDYFIRLADADVHDRKESLSMNEKYIIDAKKYGIRCNRKIVLIRLEKVISFSLLEDVVDY